MVIRYSKRSLKFLAKQEKSTIDRIKGAIIKLTYTPPESELEILYIDEIGNRGDIYK